MYLSALFRGAVLCALIPQWGCLQTGALPGAGAVPPAAAPPAAAGPDMDTIVRAVERAVDGRINAAMAGASEFGRIGVA